MEGMESIVGKAEKELRALEEKAELLRQLVTTARRLMNGNGHGNGHVKQASPGTAVAAVVGLLKAHGHPLKGSEVVRRFPKHQYSSISSALGLGLRYGYLKRVGYKYTAA